MSIQSIHRKFYRQIYFNKYPVGVDSEGPGNKWCKRTGAQTCSLIIFTDSGIEREMSPEHPRKA